MLTNADLHPGNILLNIKDFGNFPMDKVRQIFGKPTEVALVPFNDNPRNDSAPERVILPMPLHSIDLQHISGDITIIDFGEAFTVENPPQLLGTPASYAAPEVLLQTGQYSAAVDLWSLACCIFELRTGQKLFWALVHPIQDVLRRQVELFGPLPAPLWEKWDDRLLWFEEDGTENKDTPFPAEEQSLKEVIKNAAEQMPYLQLDTAEQKELLDLLSSLLKYMPSERVEASRIANHPWFQRW
jgi:serine/threonine-protein kinase SRPK3